VTRAILLPLRLPARGVRRACTCASDQPISTLYDGHSPNGTWQLEVRDLAPADVGKVLFYRLEWVTQ